MVHGWMVQDPAINNWLDSISDSTKTNLERCPAKLRAKVTASMYTRSHSSSAPQNPEAYLTVGHRAVGSKSEPGSGPRMGSSKSRLPVAPPAESNCTCQALFEGLAARQH